MALEQTDVIDAIGVDKATGHVVLTLIDALPWIDAQRHLLLLQEKLNAYLRFIESGEIDESYPQGRGKHRSISIRALFTPNRAGEQFLRSARQTIEQANIGFEFHCRNEQESEQRGPGST